MSLAVRVVAGVLLAAIHFHVLAADRQVVAPTEQARLWDAAVREASARLVAATAGDDAGGTALMELRELANDRRIDPVRKDAILFSYVNTLRQSDPTTIPDNVIEWLGSHASGAYLRHEESATATIPLFNVAAAARGLANQKRYQQAKIAWSGLNAENAADLLAAYPDAGEDPARLGAEAAISEMSQAQRSQLAEALDRSENAGIEALRVNLALAQKEPTALRHLVAKGPSLTAARILEHASAFFEPAQAMRLCVAGLAHADPGVRGVAIACGSRSAAGNPVSRAPWLAELETLLIDPVHGSAAAFQIARMAGPEIVGELVAKNEAESSPILARRIELIRRMRASVLLTRESEP